jgi:hypothetical protein
VQASMMQPLVGHLDAVLMDMVGDMNEVCAVCQRCNRTVRIARA